MGFFRIMFGLGSVLMEAAKNKDICVSGQEDTIRNMKQKVFDFGCFYKDYYQDKRDDEDITKVATQPYWQSLRLNKRKLEQNRIRMDIDLQDEKETIINTVAFVDNGKNKVGTFMRKVKVDKVFSKDGRILYHKKNKWLCISNVIQASGEGDMAACPNCGHMGRISSYIDGCDYCDSKFTVEEFEEKISSFQFEEDTNAKTNGIFKKIILSSLLLLVFMILAFIASIFILIINDIAHTNDTASIIIGIILYAAINLVPMLFILIIITFFVFLIFASVYMRHHYTRVEENRVYISVKDRLPGSTAEKFAQDLEYKLRNIHFAENAKEVNAFANIDLTEIIEKYRDVIECNLVKIMFLKKEETAEGCNITLKVHLKLVRLRNNKVTEENEQLILTMSARNDMKAEAVGAIQMYCCSGCGASVSLLDGGICGYCGTKLDYSRYSWMIEKYYSNVSEKEAEKKTEKKFFGQKKYMNALKKIRIKLAAIYAGLFLTGAAIITVRNWTTIQIYLHFDKYVEYVENMFDELAIMEDLSDELVQTEYETGYFEREYYYDCSGDVEYNVTLYKTYLESKGYNVILTESGIIQLSKYIKIDKYAEMYHIITIQFKDKEIRIYYDMDEEENIKAYGVSAFEEQPVSKTRIIILKKGL